MARPHPRWFQLLNGIGKSRRSLAASTVVAAVAGSKLLNR